MRAYEISVGQPLPSFNQDFHEIEVETFQEATAEAERIWRETGLPVGVHSGGCRSYFWYEIGRSGRTVNRNVPGHIIGQLEPRPEVAEAQPKRFF